MLLNTIAKLCFQRYILFIHQTLLIIQIFKYSNNYMGRKGSYMLRIIPAGARHFEDSGWLKSYMLFSFSNYYDPHNVQFGNLRAFNDDTVQPGKGGAHGAAVPIVIGCWWPGCGRRTRKMAETGRHRLVYRLQSAWPAPAG